MRRSAALPQSQIDTRDGLGTEWGAALLCPFQLRPRALDVPTLNLGNVGCPLAPAMKERLRFILQGRVSRYFIKQLAHVIAIKVPGVQEVLR